MTKATGADIKTNSPIQPVKYDINKDVLTVKFKRQSRVLSLQRLPATRKSSTWHL